MENILVWVLIISSSSNGSLLKVEDIASYDDCVHIRQKVPSSNNLLTGSYTQNEKVFSKDQYHGSCITIYSSKDNRRQ